MVYIKGMMRISATEEIYKGMYKRDDDDKRYDLNLCITFGEKSVFKFPHSRPNSTINRKYNIQWNSSYLPFFFIPDSLSLFNQRAKGCYLDSQYPVGEKKSNRSFPFKILLSIEPCLYIDQIFSSIPNLHAISTPTLAPSQPTQATAKYWR